MVRVSILITQVIQGAWIKSRVNCRNSLAIAPILLLFSAVVVWALSLPRIDVSQMNDLGLISVLSFDFYIAVLLLTCGFCIELANRPIRVAVILPHVILLIVMLYGTPALVEEMPRYAATWKHLGVTDYILRHGSVDPRIDAYFNWPGFFALSAFITEVAGVPSLAGQLAWVFVFFNVLFLAPLVMIFRASTKDPRLVWLAVWLFYLTNWVGQDYFAPQAFAFFLYLVILAVLVRWFKRTATDTSFVASTIRWIPGPARGIVARLFAHDKENASSQPWQHVGLIAAVLVIAAAMIPTHQLTPFAALFAMGLLLIFDRLQPRSLPILMLILILVWMTFMAVPYMRGRIDHHLTQVGKVEANSTRSVTGRFEGSQDHLLVLRVRVTLTLAVAALAAGGAIRRFTQGHRDQTLFLLALAPVALVVIQSYGGEMILRVYFFVLPVMAFFAAAFFYSDRHDRMRVPTTLVVGLASLALFTGFFIARYGNERMDYYTSEEVAATEYLFENAEPGSVFLSVGGTVPWLAQDYELFRRYPLGNDYVRSLDVDGVVNAMTPKVSERTAYLIITRSSKAYSELYRGTEPGAVTRFEQMLMQSEEFAVVFSNDDATILVLSETEVAMGVPR